MHIRTLILVLAMATTSFAQQTLFPLYTDTPNKTTAELTFDQIILLNGTKSELNAKNTGAFPMENGELAIQLDDLGTSYDKPSLRTRVVGTGLNEDEFWIPLMVLGEYGHRDSVGELAYNFDNRTLHNGSGMASLDWDNNALKASWSVESDFSVGASLKVGSSIHHADESLFIDLVNQSLWSKGNSGDPTITFSGTSRRLFDPSGNVMLDYLGGGSGQLQAPQGLNISGQADVFGVLNVSGTLNADTLVTGTATVGSLNATNIAASGSSTALRFLSGTGSQSTPAIAFSTETNTGIYRPAANQFGIAVTGQETFLVQRGGFDRIWSNLQYESTAGSFGQPTYSFSADDDTGLYRVGTNDMGFSAGGALKAGVDSTGLYLNSGSRMYLLGSGSGTVTVSGTGTLSLASGTNAFTILSTTGNVTLGDASGDSLTINAGTVTAPNATSTASGNNLINLTTQDARFLGIAARASGTDVMIGTSTTTYVTPASLNNATLSLKALAVESLVVTGSTPQTMGMDVIASGTSLDVSAWEGNVVQLTGTGNITNLTGLSGLVGTTFTVVSTDASGVTFVHGNNIHCPADTNVSLSGVESARILVFSASQAIISK